MPPLVLIVWLSLTTGATGQGTVCLPVETAQTVIARERLHAPELLLWTIPCPTRQKMRG